MSDPEFFRLSDLQLAVGIPGQFDCGVFKLTGLIANT
jgi:hypothetical protein